jgi:hypothetical protein
MDSLLGAAALLVALFMIVAAVAEQVLEVFRDLLEQLGLTGLRRGISVDEALRAADLQLDEGDRLAARIEALRALGERFPAEFPARREALERLKADLTAAAGPEAIAAVAARVAQVAARLRAAGTRAERRRVLVLRALSIALCLLLCWATGFDALQAVASAYPDLLGDSPFAQASWPGMLATAVAASSGSAFWHDILDRVRATKAATARLSALVRG